MNIVQATIGYGNLQSILNSHLKHIESIIRKSSEALEGNCFYDHATLNLIGGLQPKQENLFWAGGRVQERVCEIGFNAGHSCLLMLLGKSVESFDFTIFDDGSHKYMLPAFEYVKSQFPSIQFEMIVGDSTTEMPKWIEKNADLCGTYDVVHVDGGHSDHCIRNDMINATKLVKIGGIVIVDDTQMSDINGYVDKYLQTGKFSEVDVLPTCVYTHRIIQRIE